MMEGGIEIARLELSTHRKIICTRPSPPLLLCGRILPNNATMYAIFIYPYVLGIVGMQHKYQRQTHATLLTSLRS